MMMQTKKPAANPLMEIAERIREMREEATERFGLEGAAGIDTAQTAEQGKR